MSKLLSELPVGSLVKDTGTKYNSSTIIWRILGHNHDGQGTTSLEAKDILSLKCFDAKEPNNPNSDRKSYGNNRYLHSNLLQWLNSDAAAGEWYTAQHEYDNAPTTKDTDTNYNAYTNKPGFLNGFSANLKAALQTVTKTTALNTVTDGGSYETVSSKIFLLSTTEVGLANENSIAEGSIYAYYNADNTNSRRLKYPTAEAVSESDYTNANFKTTSPWYWWLRTPNSSNSRNARYVGSDGSLYSNIAYYGGNGVSPAYVLLSSVTVSDQPDSDGAYVIEWQQPRTIPLSDAPVGAVIKDSETNYNGSPILSRVLGHNHDGQGTTSLEAKDILTLKCFDAKEPNNSDSGRQQYGNNRYLYSNILQWLNSDATQWYTAQHAADQAPDSSNVWQSSGTAINPYDTEKGFLANFSANFKAALQTVSKITAKNTVTDGGGYETVSSKVFLLSTTEVGLADENNVAEGSIYAFYQADNTNARRLKKLLNGAAKGNYAAAKEPWSWWLRTPNSSDSRYARNVLSGGSLGSYDAYFGCSGVSPAYVLPSSVMLSAQPDGSYEFVWNAAPTISVDSETLGDKNKGFSITYSITDTDGDTVTANVKLDGTTKVSDFTVDQTETYTFTISDSDFRALSTGSHTIQINATDSNGATSQKNITFNRINSVVSISGSDGDKGNIWLTPTLTYQISDTGETTVDVVEKIDNVTTNIISGATLDTDITFDMSTFDSLTDEASHTLTIVATNADSQTATREWTFTKLYDKLIFYSDTIQTDQAAKKINVVVDYVKTNSPTLKVEVSNDGAAVSPTWEDATTEVLAGEVYEFVNTPSSGLGVKVRITLTKNANTERVYVNDYAFSYA